MGDLEREHSPGQEEGEKAKAGQPRENLDSRVEGDQHVKIDLYQIAELICRIRVEQLKQQGWIRRVEDIEDEWEQDDHFDDLKRVYQEVYWEMGLAWPPPPVRKS